MSNFTPLPEVDTLQSKGVKLTNKGHFHDSGPNEEDIGAISVLYDAVAELDRHYPPELERVGFTTASQRNNVLFDDSATPDHPEFEIDELNYLYRLGRLCRDIGIASLKASVKHQYPPASAAWMLELAKSKMLEPAIKMGMDDPTYSEDDLRHLRGELGATLTSLGRVSVLMAVQNDGDSDFFENGMLQYLSASELLTPDVSDNRWYEVSNFIRMAFAHKMRGQDERSEEAISNATKTAIQSEGRDRIISLRHVLLKRPLLHSAGRAKKQVLKKP